VPLEVSINAVMVGLVDHASHTIWDAGAPGQAPKTDKAWEEVQHHAIQLAAAGSVIAIPGTGKSDAAWVKTPEWQRYAKELADVGVLAWKAAESKDIKGITDSGDKLVATCEGCHKVYKGDLPTEGILHPH
jgi:cytochrome c556